MDFVKNLIDWLLHFDTHLKDIVGHYHNWTLAILFLIIFCETGLVVTPFLPGDSLLFVAGALAADKLLPLPGVVLVILGAAIIGDTANYHIGQFIGPRVFKEGRRSRFLKREHLEKTEAFFEKYGGKTIVIARFVPIVRTFAPFVAGMGSMRYTRFLAYNVTGALIWVVGLVMLGFAFGNLEVVQNNFELVVLAIIVISLLPPIFEVVKARREKKRAAAGSTRD
jgi:membrane-associated protein